MLLPETTRQLARSERRPNQEADSVRRAVVNDQPSNDRKAMVGSRKATQVSARIIVAGQVDHDLKVVVDPVGHVPKTTLAGQERHVPKAAVVAVVVPKAVVAAVVVPKAVVADADPTKVAAVVVPKAAVAADADPTKVAAVVVPQAAADADLRVADADLRVADVGPKDAARRLHSRWPVVQYDHVGRLSWARR
jgi:hypothetical protein